jgi:hypothetical protein
MPRKPGRAEPTPYRPQDLLIDCYVFYEPRWTPKTHCAVCRQLFDPRTENRTSMVVPVVNPGQPIGRCCADCTVKIEQTHQSRGV